MVLRLSTASLDNIIIFYGLLGSVASLLIMLVNWKSTQKGHSLAIQKSTESPWNKWQPSNSRTTKKMWWIVQTSLLLPITRWIISETSKPIFPNTPPDSFSATLRSTLTSGRSGSNLERSLITIVMNHAKHQSRSEISRFGDESETHEFNDVRSGYNHTSQGRLGSKDVTSLKSPAAIDGICIPLAESSASKSFDLLEKIVSQTTSPCFMSACKNKKPVE